MISFEGKSKRKGRWFAGLSISSGIIGCYCWIEGDFAVAYASFLIAFASTLLSFFDEKEGSLSALLQTTKTWIIGSLFVSPIMIFLQTQNPHYVDLGDGAGAGWHRGIQFLSAQDLIFWVGLPVVMGSAILFLPKEKVKEEEDSNILRGAMVSGNDEHFESSEKYER